MAGQLHRFERMEYRVSNLGAVSKAYHTIDDGSDCVSVDYLNQTYGADILIPVEIFATSLTPFQSIVKYLREQKSMSNSRIAQLLHSSPSTCSITYGKVKKSSLTVGSSELYVKLSNLLSRDLTVAESLVVTLSNRGYSGAQIGRLINRNHRTISSLHRRARIKEARSDN